MGILDTIVRKVLPSAQPNIPQDQPQNFQDDPLAYEQMIDSGYGMYNDGMRPPDMYGPPRHPISEEVQRILVTPDIPEAQKISDLWILFSSHLQFGNINAREQRRIKRKFKFLIMFSHFGSPQLLREKVMEVFGGEILLSKSRGDKERMRERDAQVSSISEVTSRQGRIERPKDNTNWTGALQKGKY